MERALQALPLTDPSNRFWLACEAAAMRDICKHLLTLRNLACASLTTQGYWKYGAGNYSDHDFGLEPNELLSGVRS